MSYGSRQNSDFPKLASLGSEGRSTATTILTLSAIRNLNREEDLTAKARKLLSFTDNRQDASLQAGHFNDFVEIGLLRSALYDSVLKAGAQGLTHDELNHRVFESLNLPIELYASDPQVRFQARNETERALREVLGYRIYRDLEKGWRITAPNLEQCGLLEIRYSALDELCESQDVWQGRHLALVSASPGVRARIAKVLLDFMRRGLAIKVDYLRADYQERIQQVSSQRLNSPWALDEDERVLEQSCYLFPRSSSPRDMGDHIFLSARSGFGQYLRRPSTFEDNLRLSLIDTQGETYVIKEPESGLGRDPALVLSLSATIDASRVLSVLGQETPIWTVNISLPHNDFLKSRQHLREFRVVIRRLMDRMKAAHGESATIHIFPAVPVAMAVELGRVMMPKADLPIRIYDQNRQLGGFSFALEINSRAKVAGPFTGPTKQSVGT